LGRRGPIGGNHYRWREERKSTVATEGSAVAACPECEKILCIDMRGWTLGEKIEIAVYKFIETFNRSEPKDTSVGQLARLVPSSENVDVTRALVRLYDQRCVKPDKWVGGEGRHVPFSEFPTESSFFYGPPYGDFRVGMAPEGQIDFEKRAQQQPLVFISCGQWHDHEKRLGQDLLAAVNETAPLRGYFAEYQSSLSNLSRHIFEALDQCVALVAVMHQRGIVMTPDGQIMRASVWVEQEVAIAAFLTERLSRRIEIAAYIQKGISLEGLRSQLILNPVEFETDDEVLSHFKSLLPTWKTLVG